MGNTGDARMSLKKVIPSSIFFPIFFWLITFILIRVGFMPQNNIFRHFTFISSIHIQYWQWPQGQWDSHRSFGTKNNSYVDHTRAIMAPTEACSWWQSAGNLEIDNVSGHRPAQTTMGFPQYHHPLMSAKNCPQIDFILYDPGDTRLVICIHHALRCMKPTFSITWGHRGAHTSRSLQLT